jgi:hypothetical protein
VAVADMVAVTVKLSPMAAVADTAARAAKVMAVAMAPSPVTFPMVIGKFLTGESDSFSTMGAFSAPIVMGSSMWRGPLASACRFCLLKQFDSTTAVPLTALSMIIITAAQTMAISSSIHHIGEM